jgi:hypothetical protein
MDSHKEHQHADNASVRSGNPSCRQRFVCVKLTFSSHVKIIRRPEIMIVDIVIVILVNRIRAVLIDHHHSAGIFNADIA